MHFVKINEQLIRPVNAAGLGLFRVLFGLVCLFQVLYFQSNGFVKNDIIKPIIHFKFYWFSFVEPFSEGVMNFMLFLLAVFAVLIMAGRLYKLAIAGYFFIFTYFWLIDKGYFNNHYYLISILCGLMFLADADKWSPFGKVAAQKMIKVPHWQVLTLKIQVLIVFTWAAINKMNTGWILNHQPVEFILKYKAEFTGNAGWDSDFLTTFLIWGGLIFDFVIIPMLWWKKTRLIAFIGMVLFNSFNYWVFHDVGEIGIFPLLVMVSTVLYFDPDVIHLKVCRIYSLKVHNANNEKSKEVVASSWKMYLFGGFLIFQALFPARHFLIPGHVDWTGEGQRFAWRMKIMYKDFDMHFYMVEDGGHGQKFEVNLGNMLTPKQYTALGYYPDLVPPTAVFLKSEALKKGLKDPVIQVDFTSGLNGGQRQRLLDPTVDASRLELHPLRHSEWIIPYNN